MLSIIGASMVVGRLTAAPCQLAERRDALLKRATIVAAEGELLATVPRLFAPDGIYLTPGALTSRGPAGARAWLERDSLNRTSRARMITVGGDVSQSGDDGFTYGYLDAVRASGELVPAWYHAYWRRGLTGAWEIVAIARRPRPDGPTSGAHPGRSLAGKPCVEPRATVDTAALAREIEAADIAFAAAAAAGVGNAFASAATEDVAKSGKKSAYVFGREDVRLLFDPPPPKGLVWQPELSSAARGGDFGFTVGIAGPRDGTPLSAGAAAKGHYFTVWRRDADGVWRYVVD